MLDPKPEIQHNEVNSFLIQDRDLPEQGLQDQVDDDEAANDKCQDLKKCIVSKREIISIRVEGAANKCCGDYKIRHQ